MQNVHTIQHKHTAFIISSMMSGIVGIMWVWDCGAHANHVYRRFDYALICPIQINHLQTK